MTASIEIRVLAGTSVLSEQMCLSGKHISPRLVCVEPFLLSVIFVTFPWLLYENSAQKGPMSSSGKMWPPFLYITADYFLKPIETKPDGPHSKFF